MESINLAHPIIPLLLMMIYCSMISSAPQTEIYTQENCNATLTGPSGVWKKVELITNPASYRLWPFTCHITFHAKGTGDRLVHLDFEDLNLGGSDKLCRRGHISILDVDGPTDDESMGGNELSPRIPLSPSSSLSALDPGSNDGLDVAGKFCWLARRGSKEPSPFYSEHNTVRLMVRGNAWFDTHGSPVPAPIRFSLRYRFVPRDRAYGRYGNLPNDPNQGDGQAIRGAELPGTYCDRIFVDCKDCRVRSPGWPGTYLRNLTCRYYVLNKRNRGPNSHVVVKAGPGARDGMTTLDLPGPNWSKRGQGSSEGILRSGSEVGGGGLLFLNCLSDRIEIYDGSAPKADSLIGTFCGHGLLPTIVSTKPDVLVKFVSAESGALGLPGFELVTHSVISSDSGGSSIMQLPKKIKHRCEFVINGSDSGSRKGKFSSLQHWIKPNTTCSITFRGGPADRVFLVFEKFFINPSSEDGYVPRDYNDALPIDQMYNDISEPTNQAVNCKRVVTIGLGTQGDEGDTSLLGSKLKFCPGGSPFICPVSFTSGQVNERACEVGKESYLSLDNQAQITYHEPLGSYDGTNIMFEGRYEFIDTSVPEEGEHIPGTLCDLLFRQTTEDDKATNSGGMEDSSTIWKSVSAPRNVMLYGMGGRNHLRCVYEFMASPGYVVEMDVKELTLGDSFPKTSSLGMTTLNQEHTTRTSEFNRVCHHAFNQTTMAYDCLSNNPRRHLRIVSGDGREMGCYCGSQITPQDLEETIIRRLDTVRVEFSLHGLRPWEGPDSINFNVSYRYVKKRACEEISLQSTPERGVIKGLVDIIGSSKDIEDNDIVENKGQESDESALKDPFYGMEMESEIPRTCSWKIKVHPKHHIYLRFERLNLDIDCDREKLLFYSLGSPKPFKILCQRDHVDERQIFSEGWYLPHDDTPIVSLKNDIQSDQPSLESPKHKAGKDAKTKVQKNVKRYNSIIVELIYSVKLRGGEINGNNQTTLEKFLATWVGVIKPATSVVVSEEVKEGTYKQRKYEQLKHKNDIKQLFKGESRCPFQCPGSCISEDFVCDGIPDCPGHYDLTNSPDERIDLCAKYVPKNRKAKADFGNDQIMDNETTSQLLETPQGEKDMTTEQNHTLWNGDSNASDNLTESSLAVKTIDQFFDKLKKIPVWLYTVLIIIILTLICSIVGFVIVLFINSRNRRGRKGAQVEKNGSYKNGHGMNGIKGQHKSMFSLWKLKPGKKQKYHQVNIVPAGALIDEIDMPSVNSESETTGQSQQPPNFKKNFTTANASGNSKGSPLTSTKQKEKSTNGINHIKYRYFQGPKSNGSSKSKPNINTVEV